MADDEHQRPDREELRRIRRFVEAVQGGEGDLYWVASLYRDVGTFEGQPIDHVTAETMLLRRVGGRWRIAHLHWSTELPGSEGAPNP